MNEYEIVFAPTANEDLANALGWLVENSPEDAPQWLEDLEKKISTLSTMPERCPLAPENERWGSEKIYSLLFDEYPSKYRILFTISEQTVQILNIRHGSRRWLHEEP